MAVIYESRESSSPMITRAVAAGLSHAKFVGYEFSPVQKTALKAVSHLPQKVARILIPLSQSGLALDMEHLKDLRTDDLVRGRLADYAGVPGQFPAVVMGVGMGGATAHLSLALNAPFLPQAFVMTIKKGSVD